MPRGKIVQSQFGLCVEDGQGQQRLVRSSVVEGDVQLAVGMTVEFEATGTAVTYVRLPVGPPADEIDAPYHHHPVTVAHGAPVIDRPVFHDGANEDQPELRSGELRISFEALTPLLAANDQYEAWEAVQDQKPQTEGATVSLPATWGVTAPVKATKKILEPLRLPVEDGRVLIPSAQLKGMLRRDLGALLLAPMERVAERVYFHMPNRSFPRNSIGLATRPAVLRGSAANGGLEVDMVPVIDDWDGVRFVDAGARKKLAQALNSSEDALAGTHILKGTQVSGAEDSSRQVGGQEIKKLLKGAYTDSWPADHDYIYCDYASGLDGDGTLSRAFGKPGRYVGALVRADAEWTRTTIDPAAVEHYSCTLDGLADDRRGHISARHPMRSKFDARSIQNSIEQLRQRVVTQPQPYRLLYVLIQPEQSDRIASFGHHFRFRTRYADTVRKKYLGIDPDGRENTEIRAILLPIREELEPLWPGEAASPPKALSGARLLFGYTADDKDGDHSGTGGIGGPQGGRSDFKRLAGRLAFNMALEQVEPGAGDARFLEANNACVVPLKPLGLPRASSPETSLAHDRSAVGRRPDNARMQTYGDWILAPRDQPGELAGRRDYVNQPDAATDPQCYREGNDEVLKGDQAALARFVLAPGARFKVTLRFHDLRPWELGAVLFALEPERACDHLGGKLPVAVRSYFKQWSSEVSEQKPRFAHKLGHGRPLGLGSIRVTVDQMRYWGASPQSPVQDDQSVWTEDALIEDAEDRIWKQAIDAAWEVYLGPTVPAQARQVREAALLQWLKIRQYAGRTRYDYPRPARGGDIFAFHTGTHNAHNQAFRELPGSQRELAPEILKPLP